MTGFSLLEVLAAVAVMGILYTILASLHMDGMRHEGDADRRLRHSLVADRTLAELEHAFLTGSAPPVGTQETDEGDYTLRVDVRPLDLSLFAAGLLEVDEDGEAPPALLTAPRAGAPPLVEVEVVVTWVEGAYEREIRRLTYGFDATAAAPILETLPTAGGGSDTQADDDGGGGDEEDRDS